MMELFSKLLMGGFSQPQSFSQPQNSYYPSSSYPNAPYGNNTANTQGFDNSSMMPLLLSLMGGGGVSSLTKGLPEPFAALLSQQTKSSPQSGEQHEKNIPHDEIIL